MDTSERAFELLKAGDFDGLRNLLTETGVADARDANGVSLLMHVIYRGQRDLAKALAARKQELDLFEAASLGRTDRLQELLQGDSTVNDYSKDGFTALHFASYFGQPQAARLLIDHGAKVDTVAANPTRVMPLHSAASSRNLEGARLLLEHGAPINARQQAAWVPLHAAAQNGDRDMIALFLEHRADVNLANDDGKTAAMVAREKGHTQIAEVLEQRGARS